jgi:hypothetical protein
MANSKDSEEDILDVTPPAHIPGVLFKACADELYERYPISRRKAELAALGVLGVVFKFYEEVAKLEEPE